MAKQMAKQMKYGVRFLENEEHGRWDQFVSQTPGGNLFIKTSWLDAITYVMGGEAKYIGCFKGDELVGGLAVWVRETLVGRTVQLPPYTPYNGVVSVFRQSKYSWKSEKDCLDIATAIRDFLEHEFAYVTLLHPPAWVDIRSFEWTQWKCWVRYTYLMNMNGTLNDQINPDIKRRAEIATKSGVSITGCNDPKILFRLIDHTYSRQKESHPLLFGQFVELCNKLLDSGQLEIRLACLSNGTPIAANGILVDSLQAYYWVAGANPTYFETGANQLLILGTFDSLSGRVDILDCLGAFIRWVAFNKSQWGGELRPYYWVSKACSRKARLLYGSRDFLRTIGVLRGGW